MSGRRKTDKRKCRVSTRDNRLMNQMKGYNRLEEHERGVKEMDQDLKIRSGENRMTPARRASLRNSQNNNNTRISFTSDTNTNSVALQFLRDKGNMMDSVKDKLRKLLNPKKVASEKDGWSRVGATRESLLHGWSKYSKCRSKITQYQGFSDYPSDHVTFLESGEEHPKRLVKCFTCNQDMESTGEYYMNEGKCLHKSCLESLIL
jgi:hypothetical protein